MREVRRESINNEKWFLGTRNVLSFSFKIVFITNFITWILSIKNEELLVHLFVKSSRIRTTDLKEILFLI